jgi:phage terminase small subunit
LRDQLTTKTITEVSLRSEDLEQLEKAIINQLGQKITIIIEEKVTSKLQVIVNQLEQKLPKTFETQINYALKGAVEQISAKIDESLKTTKKNSSKDKNKEIDDQDPKIKQILNDLNTMSLDSLKEKLSKSKNNRFAEPIFNRRSKQLFTSTNDVMTVKGKQGGELTINTMQKIIANW